MEFSLHQENGVHIVDADVTGCSPEEAARTGWLIDLGTSRTGAGPARPDDQGRIRRELAPDVNVANFSAMLDGLGRLAVES